MGRTGISARSPRTQMTPVSTGSTQAHIGFRIFVRLWLHAFGHDRADLGRCPVV